MYIDFQQNRVCIDQSKPCTQIYLHNIANLHKFATTNSNFEKKTILVDMHHHKTYMYINCQQNQVKTQVITVQCVHTSLFAKKIASCINCNYQ